MAANLRRGFWRLALLFWATGAVAIVWWSDEPLASPFPDVCTPEVEPPYAECQVAAAEPPPEAEPGVVTRWLGRAREAWRGIDETREVPRWRTQRYRDALRNVAVREAWWLALVWGPFYLVAWAFAGFRSASGAGRSDE